MIRNLYGLTCAERGRASKDADCKRLSGLDVRRGIMWKPGGEPDDSGRDELRWWSIGCNPQHGLLSVGTGHGGTASRSLPKWRPTRSSNSTVETPTVCVVLDSPQAAYRILS